MFRVSVCWKEEHAADLTNTLAAGELHSGTGGGCRLVTLPQQKPSPAVTQEQEQRVRRVKTKSALNSGTIVTVLNLLCSKED